MSAAPKKRLDELLVDQGLAESRSQAKALILAGKVKLGTERLDKPGRALPVDSLLAVDQPPRFVSRGGDKLEGFLNHFGIAVDGCHVLDIGASTGGFTDCCLQRGALSSTCVDVGRAQLHNKLVQDRRVTNLERTNARHLQAGDLPRDHYSPVVMDLSFISLTKVLPAVWPFVAADGLLIALVKPQFEAKKAEVDAGKGIIRDPEVRQRVLDTIRTFAIETLSGAEIVGSIDSPIAGTDGNREFLLGLRKRATA